MPFSEPSNYFLEEYVRNNRGKSRYEIDLYLLEQGYSPELIEDFWKTFAAKESSFYLFKPRSWKYLKRTPRIILLAIIALFFVVILSLEFVPKIITLFPGPATHLYYEIKMEGGVNAIAFSPDSRYLAIQNTRGIVFWTIPDRKSVFGVFGDNPSNSQTLTWSPNGYFLAFSDQTGQVYISTVPPDILDTIKTTNTEIKSLSFSPDGLSLAIAGDTQPIQVWSFNENRHLAGVLDCVADKVKFLSYDHLLGLSKDGSLCDFAFSDTKPAVKQVKNLDSLSQEDKIFFSAVNKGKTFSPDYQILAESTVLVSDPVKCRSSIGPVIKLSWVNGGSIIENLEAPQCGTSEVAFSPDGKVLAAAGNDGIVRIWYLNREFPRLG